MILALGPVLLVVASLLLGGLMSLTMLGLLLFMAGRQRPHAALSEPASWREEPNIAPVQDGTAVVAPER